MPYMNQNMICKEINKQLLHNSGRFPISIGNISEIYRKYIGYLLEMPNGVNQPRNMYPYPVNMGYVMNFALVPVRRPPDTEPDRGLFDLCLDNNEMQLYGKTYDHLVEMYMKGRLLKIGLPTIQQEEKRQQELKEEEFKHIIEKLEFKDKLRFKIDKDLFPREDKALPVSVGILTNTQLQIRSQKSSQGNVPQHQDPLQKYVHLARNNLSNVSRKVFFSHRIFLSHRFPPQEILSKYQSNRSQYHVTKYKCPRGTKRYR